MNLWNLAFPQKDDPVAGNSEGQLTREEIIDLVNAISYKPGWGLTANFEGDRWYLQVFCMDGVDSRTGKRTNWKGAKRFLSKWMCRQEIVGIAFDLFRSAEEHECREWFRYRGKSIYNPHLNPDALVDLIKGHYKPIVQRRNSMTMEEPKS